MWDLKPINKLVIFLYTKVHLSLVPDSVTWAAHLKIQVHCVTSIPLYLLSRKGLPSTQFWVTTVCLSVVLPGARGAPGKTPLLQLASQTIARVRSANTTLPFRVPRKCFVGTSHAVTLNNTKLVLVSPDLLQWIRAASSGSSQLKPCVREEFGYEGSGCCCLLAQIPAVPPVLTLHHRHKRQESAQSQPCVRKIVQITLPSQVPWQSCGEQPGIVSHILRSCVHSRLKLSKMWTETWCLRA